MEVREISPPLARAGWDDFTWTHARENPAMTKQDARRRLIWHGMVLFLIGLLTGFIIPLLTNPRLGLSAHIEALLNGMALVLVGGVVWDNMRVSQRIAVFVFWLLVFAAYANWGFCLLAAFFGGSEMLPLASAGHAAASWQDVPVRLGLGLGAVSITVASVCILVGLREKAAESTPAV
jgi:hydroxylaminobenzene mutase